MDSRRLWLITYDIANPRRLRRAAQALERSGDRVQKSVYEAHLAEADRRRLRASFINDLDPSKDSLLWHPLCRSCTRAITWQGRDAAIRAQTYWVV